MNMTLIMALLVMWQVKISACESKKTMIIFYFLRRMHFCLSRTCCPLFIQCFDCCLVSGMKKDTIDSSWVTILSKSPSPVDHVSFKMLLHLSHLSFFWSPISSLGTERVDLFTRPRSSERIMIIVSLLWPWTEASSQTVCRQPSSSSAATTVNLSYLSLFFFMLECRWSAAIFPTLTSLIIWYIRALFKLMLP
jgi:hypothetical protein